MPPRLQKQNCTNCVFCTVHVQCTHNARTVHCIQCTLQATKCCKYQGISAFLDNFHPKKIKLQVVSSTAATFYFYTSFWSVLRSQALETPQLSFCNLYALKSCWPWPGSAPKLPKPSSEPCWAWPGCSKTSQTFSGIFSGTWWTWLGFAPRLPGTSGTFSGTPLSLTWLCTKASWNLLRNLLRNAVELDLALTKSFPDLALQSLPDLLRNLLRNPVEPDLALHQSLPDLHRNLLHNPVEAELALHQSLPNLLRELLRNLPRNLLRNPVESDLALHQSLRSGFFSGTFLGIFSGTLLNLTWLGLKPPKPSPEPSPQPSPEPCWTWQPPKAPRPSLESFRNLPGTLRNLTWLCTKASPTFSRTNLLRNPVVCTKASQTFSGSFGAFSGTSLNLTPHLHQCTPGFSRLKAPFAYNAVGEKYANIVFFVCVITVFGKYVVFTAFCGRAL